MSKQRSTLLPNWCGPGVREFGERFLQATESAWVVLPKRRLMVDVEVWYRSVLAMSRSAERFESTAELHRVR